MQSLLFMLIVFLAGAMLPMQAGLNHKMGKALASPEYASFISFGVGTLALFIYLLFIKQDLTTFGNLVQIPWYVWLAGIMGAFYVTTVLIMAPRLGIALTFGLVVAGQMVLSLFMDHFGLLGMPVKALNWPRIAGALLLIAGVVIIRKS